MIISSTLELNVQKYERHNIKNSNEEVKTKYSSNYRVFKTFLLFIAWVSFGMNNELIGPTFEDLRILLNLTYDGISTGLVIRWMGTLSMMFLSGYLYDNMSTYADLLMALSGFLMVLRKIISLCLNKIK